jgi:hypothetical protein
VLDSKRFLGQAETWQCSSGTAHGIAWDASANADSGFGVLKVIAKGHRDLLTVVGFRSLWLVLPVHDKQTREQKRKDARSTAERYGATEGSKPEGFVP